MKKYDENIKVVTKKCIEELNVDKKMMDKCAKGIEGKKILLKYAKRAKRVKIIRDPSVVIDGKI